MYSKNIVKKYLLSLNPELEAKLIEYDRIRTDNFKNRDLFDLKEKYESDAMDWFKEQHLIEEEEEWEKLSFGLMMKKTN